MEVSKDNDQANNKAASIVNNDQKCNQTASIMDEVHIDNSASTDGSGDVYILSIERS